MITLGAQLQSEQFTAFRQGLAAQLPDLTVQTVNAAGKCVINGRLTAEQVATISAIYAEQAADVMNFDMLAYQSMERQRRQTHNATQKRRAMGMRFHR